MAQDMFWKVETLLPVGCFPQAEIPKQNAIPNDTSWWRYAWRVSEGLSI